jgi:hypothetical protein
MISKKPILFSQHMVAANLEGRKTMTRRIIKEQPVRDEIIDGQRYLKPAGWPLLPVSEFIERFCPYGKIGDVLWVREEHYRFGHWEPVPGIKTATGRQKWVFVPETDEVRYYDNPPAEFRGGRHHKDPFTPAWYKRLARFMYYEHCRLFLKITDIRVERLQDISEEDAIAEGANPAYHRCGGYGYYEGGGEIWDCICQKWESSEAVMGFKELWESINGPGSWQVNPWVWVVSFERTNKPE